MCACECGEGAGTLHTLSLQALVPKGSDRKKSVHIRLCDFIDQPHEPVRYAQVIWGYYLLG